MTARIDVEVPELLQQLITLHRPAYGKGEAATRAFIRNYAEERDWPTYIDTAGNLFVYVCADESRTLFTAHMDSATRTEGTNNWRVEGNKLKSADDTILGCDDAAGMYLMCRMIDVGVPGTYAFFTAEEVGGVGSAAFADDTDVDFTQWDRAIAFDRAGTKDVITHQAGGRCCSDNFAWALANALGCGYRPDSTGIFTDTAQLTELIHECTNISVGYQFEHSRNEEQDLDHLEWLAVMVTKIDWDDLPTVRDCEQSDGFPSNSASPEELDDLQRVIESSPDLVARLLHDSGYDRYELINVLYDYSQQENCPYAGW